MGVDFSFLPFFDACKEQGLLEDPLLALGSLTIQESPEAILALAKEHEYRTLEKEKTVQSLMRDRYAIGSYFDCDLNAKADLYMDLSKPLDPNLCGRFRTILNGGTLEHIFDIRQALANVHDLTCVGGNIIHLAPMTWIDHAYFNFNPLMFRAIAESNNYALHIEAFHFVSPPTSGCDGKAKVHFIADGSGKRQADEMVPEILNGSTLPANVLYMVALRKHNKVDFKTPYDILR